MDFVPFTKGIDLNEEDFNFIAQRAINGILETLNIMTYNYYLYQACELSFILEKLILKYLKKPELNTPEDIISSLSELAKDLRFTDHFRFTFRRPLMTCLSLPYIFQDSDIAHELSEKFPDIYRYSCCVGDTFKLYSEYEYSELDTNNPVRDFLKRREEVIKEFERLRRAKHPGITFKETDYERDYHCSQK